MPCASSLFRSDTHPTDVYTLSLHDALPISSDGAAAGARVVFGVILGTGVGGGIVVDGQVLTGANAIAGEWGHNPLPRSTPDRSEEHTSELQSHVNLVCRLLLEKKKLLRWRV